MPDYSALKNQILNDIQQNPKANINRRLLNQKIVNETATYDDASNFSKVLGDTASKSITRNIAEGVADKELETFATECLAPVYQNCQDTMLSASKSIQKLYNKQAGINLNPVEVKRDQDRIDNIVNRFKEAASFNDVAFLTNKNTAQSVTRGAVNDSIRENARFQENVGVDVLISRSDGSGCCDWCASVCGTFKSFEALPDGFWGVHRGCTCVIDYRVGKTKSKLSYTTGKNGKITKITDADNYKYDDEIKRIPQFPASLISEKVKNGEYSLKLSKQQYDKHVTGTKTYEAYEKARIEKGLSPQSRLSVSFKNAQNIIEKYSGTGIIRSDRKGNPMNVEDVTCNKIIGEYMQKGEWIKTNKAALHHSKNGTHIVPIKGSNYD